MKRIFVTTVMNILLLSQALAQDIFEKKGMWGISYGVNIYYPVDNKFTVGFYTGPINRYQVCYYKPRLTVGHFFEASKNFRLKKINNYNILYVVPSLSMYQTKYNILYQYFSNAFVYHHEGILKLNYFLVIVGLKLVHTVNFENNNTFFTFFSINYNHILKNLLRLRGGCEHITSNFGLGYSFKFKKVYFSPFIQHEFYRISLPLQRYYSWYSSHIYDRIYNNMLFGILFNF